MHAPVEAFKKKLAYTPPKLDATAVETAIDSIRLNRSVIRYATQPGARSCRPIWSATASTASTTPTA